MVAEKIVEQVSGQAISLAPSDINWDPSIYPRDKWSTSTIERYADAMRSGAVFPPVIVEAGTHRLLDGKHRWEAWKKATDQPDLAETDIPVLRVEAMSVPDGVPVKMFAASLSARHGDRLKLADLKSVVREVYEENPSFKQQTVADLFGVRQQAVSEMVSDILAREREERAGTALRLSLLGWTQAEIASHLEVGQKTISNDLSNFTDSGIFTKGISPDEIARRYNLALPVVYAKQLQDSSDEERLARLDIKTQPYDVWHFPKCHDLMGDAHPGRIPGELVTHVMYFYTNQGDLVIDPMAGSGTTLDAAMLMGRKARGYDIDHRHDRKDVEHWDLDDGWPDSIEKADLVFWDPPYFDKMDSATIGDDGYIEQSISKLAPDIYMKFFERAFAELVERAKPGTRLAFLMSDWDPENAKQHGDHPGLWLWDYARAMQDAGLTIDRHIQVPLSTQQVHPDIVNKFRASRRLARLERYLLVAHV